MELATEHLFNLLFGFTLKPIIGSTRAYPHNVGTWIFRF